MSEMTKRTNEGEKKIVEIHKTEEERGKEDSNWTYISSKPQLPHLTIHYINNLSKTLTAFRQLKQIETATLASPIPSYQSMSDPFVLLQPTITELFSFDKTTTSSYDLLFRTIAETPSTEIQWKWWQEQFSLIVVHHVCSLFATNLPLLQRIIPSLLPSLFSGSFVLFWMDLSDSQRVSIQTRLSQLAEVSLFPSVTVCC